MQSGPCESKWLMVKIRISPKKDMKTAMADTCSKINTLSL
jgi:hypothetical protein